MVSDQDRRDLYVALEERLGGGPAATMMELLPPVGWADVARQGDLVAVRGEIAQLRSELKGEMAELRGELAELRGEIGQVRGGMAELRGEIKAQLPRLVVANIGMAFGTAGLVLAAAKLA
jgi:hypothetical protein